MNCEKICDEINQFIEKHAKNLTDAEYDQLSKVAWFILSLKSENYPIKRVALLCKVVIKFCKTVDKRGLSFIQDVKKLENWILAELQMVK